MCNKIIKSDFKVLSVLFDKDCSEVLLGKYYYIRNRDKTIRWLYPSSLQYPTYLSTYNIGTMKGKVYCALSKALFFLGVGRILATGSIDLNVKSASPIEEILQFYEGCSYSVFTGTVGDNRKFVIVASKGSEVKHFIKAPLGVNSKELIMREAAALEFIKRLNLESVVVPEVDKIFPSGALSITNIAPKKKIDSLHILDVHLRALFEISNKTMKASSVGRLLKDNNVVSNIEYIVSKNNVLGPVLSCKVACIVSGFNEIIDLLDPVEPVFVSFSHGDFTPWNLYVSQNSLSIYDWELSNNNRPIMFDFFHFIFSAHVLVVRDGYAGVKKEIASCLSMEKMKVFLNENDVELDKYFIYYFLINASHYLRLYIDQESLHVQVDWLVDAWLQSVQDILSSLNR